VTVKVRRVRQYLRQRTGRAEFTRGYRAGVGFALSLLPENGSMDEAWVKAVRAELKDRS
jgi:hypothetical protein